jgi:hypothetical protein
VSGHTIYPEGFGVLLERRIPATIARQKQAGGMRMGIEAQFGGSSRNSDERSGA